MRPVIPFSKTCLTPDRSTHSWRCVYVSVCKIMCQKSWVLNGSGLSNSLVLISPANVSWDDRYVGVWPLWSVGEVMLHILILAADIGIGYIHTMYSSRIPSLGPLYRFVTLSLSLQAVHRVCTHQSRICTPWKPSATEVHLGLSFTQMALLMKCMLSFSNYQPNLEQQHTKH